MANLPENLQKFSNQPAIIQDGITYTYQDLLNMVKAFTDKISTLPQQSKVVIHSDYNIQSISLFISLMLNKHIIIPIISDKELLNKSKECGAEFIASQETGFLPERIKIDNTVKNQLLDTMSSGLILFSSGTTGKPKAMLHNLSNLLAQFQNKKPKKFNMLLFLMFDHIGGINTLLNILTTGQCAIIPSADKRKDVFHIAQLIEQYKISILPTSPTFLNLMLLNQVHQKFDLSSLRMITYGTEAMPQPLLKKIKEAFPKVKILQTFGTSEVGIMQTVSETSESLFIKISDPNIQYKIVNNELWIKSKTQVLGYLNASMENFSDGYFRTGDLVERKNVNGEEYIKIVGRLKELINVGGEKVLPQEVEGIILQIDGVLDCLVYGEKNSITGQSVTCELVIDENKIKKIEAKKVVRLFCKGKIENYKIPTKVIVLPSLEISERFKKKRLYTSSLENKQEQAL